MMALTDAQYRIAYNEAIRLIKAFEGCHLTAYLCPAGHWTIGWGLTSIYGRAVKEGDTITLPEAERLLGIFVAACIHTVESLVIPELHPHEMAALTSFEYNEGVGAFHSSTLLRLLNAGKFLEASDEFDRWVYAKVNGKMTVLAGLVRRRNAEEAEFELDGRGKP